MQNCVLVLKWHNPEGSDLKIMLKKKLQTRSKRSLSLFEQQEVNHSASINVFSSFILECMFSSYCFIFPLIPLLVSNPGPVNITYLWSVACCPLVAGGGNEQKMVHPKLTVSTFFIFSIPKWKLEEYSTLFHTATVHSKLWQNLGTFLVQLCFWTQNLKMAGKAATLLDTHTHGELWCQNRATQGALMSVSLGMLSSPLQPLHSSFYPPLILSSVFRTVSPSRQEHRAEWTNV